jgi:hypothetical protein
METCWRLATGVVLEGVLSTTTLVLSVLDLLQEIINNINKIGFELSILN